MYSLQGRRCADAVRGEQLNLGYSTMYGGHRGQQQHKQVVLTYKYKYSYDMICMIRHNFFSPPSFCGTAVQQQYRPPVPSSTFVDICEKKKYRFPLLGIVREMSSTGRATRSRICGVITAVSYIGEIYFPHCACPLPLYTTAVRSLGAVMAYTNKKSHITPPHT